MKMPHIKQLIIKYIMDDFSKKLKKFLIPYITKIENPIILELGVQKGRSTTKFLESVMKTMANSIQ